MSELTEQKINFSKKKIISFILIISVFLLIIIEVILRTVYFQIKDQRDNFAIVKSARVVSNYVLTKIAKQKIQNKKGDLPFLLYKTEGKDVLNLFSNRYKENFSNLVSSINHIGWKYKISLREDIEKLYKFSIKNIV